MPKAYYLRQNHESSQPSRYLISHLMTYSEEEEGVTYLKMNFAYTRYVELGPGLEVEVCEDKTLDLQQDYQDYLLSLARDKSPLLVVSENPALDLWASGMAERLHFSDWQVRRLYHQHQNCIMSFVQKRKTLRFCSLHNWIPGTLADWAKHLNADLCPPGTEGGDAWEETGERQKEMGVLADTFYQYLSFLHTHDLGGFALTLSGQAMRAYRHRFMPEKILHYDEEAFNDFVRGGYHGGRCECFYIGNWHNWPVCRIDVNSMYPAVMKEERYPTRIKQWIKKPTLEWLKNRLKVGCVMARVKVQTDEPAYAYPHNDQLCFPIGSFWTTLCTGSLQYALDHGHIVEIEQAISFHTASLFGDYVDYFVGLKQQYETEGNSLWRAITKGFLNHLYGKFGELYGKEVFNEEDTSHDFYRRAVALVLDENGDYKKSPRRRALEEVATPGKITPGVEWCAFGRYVLTAGTMEGSNSAPAIAAHITDYARLRLWQGLKTIGLDRVYYCDTDSMVFPFIDLPKMEASIDGQQLGKWKVEVLCSDGEIHTAKSYRLGEKSYLAGIAENHLRFDDLSYSFHLLPGLYSLLRPHSFRGYPITAITKQPSGGYDKGIVGHDGRVSPLVIQE